MSAQSVPGIEAARTRIRLRRGTGEPVVPMRREKPKRMDSVRVRVPMRGTGAEAFVVGMKVL